MVYMPLQYLRRFLPFTDLGDYRARYLARDASSALAVTFMSVPQGVAYAMIAGLPPAMGLYAGALPAVVGSLFRSSRHVITGPTNALSLLVGTAVAAQVQSDPVSTAVTLAFMVGLFQLLAGVLNLGALVDYISSSVVLGYITGAGVLIGVGQLSNVTATPDGTGFLIGQLTGWLDGVGGTDPLAVALALGTAALILLLRRFAPWAPGAIVAMVTGILLAWLFGLGDRGIVLVRDLAPVPTGLPPLTLPAFERFGSLIPLATAAMVLSLVESNAVARSIAAQSGDRLDTSSEFAGQGLANLVAGFTGGYPTSGSVSRSALNFEDGARSRMSGVLTGVFMLTVLLVLGPIVDLTPIPSLAGLLLVVAVDLVDVQEIASLMSSRWSDRLAFGGTLIGTFLLPLDEAIYLGVVISLVLFLRRARLLKVREMAVDANLRLQEFPADGEGSGLTVCRAIRVLHLEGSLFFGAANELRDAIDFVLSDPDVKVLILRVKRTQGLDYTTASVLEQAHRRMREEGRHLLLVGMRQKAMDLIEETGIASTIGEEKLYPTQRGWFEAMNEGLDRALELVGDHTCRGGGCPLEQYVDRRQAS